MADNEQTTFEILRGEINKLSSQVENIVKNLENKNNISDVSDLVAKLNKEIAYLRGETADRAHKLYDAGQAGMEEVGEHVRKNPLASILVAFGAGCVISCIIRNFNK